MIRKMTQANITDYNKGTLATDLPNGLKAGEIIKLKGKSIFRMKNNKLIMIEDYS